MGKSPNRRTEHLRTATAVPTEHCACEQVLRSEPSMRRSKLARSSLANNLTDSACGQAACAGSRRAGPRPGEVRPGSPVLIVCPVVGVSRTRRRFSRGTDPEWIGRSGYCALIQRVTYEQ